MPPTRSATRTPSAAPSGSPPGPAEGAHAAPWAPIAAIVILALLASLGLSERFQRSDALLASVLGTAGVTLLLVVVGWIRMAARGETPAVSWSIQRSHWVQACLHCSIFAYWSTAWPEVREAALPILSQLLFAHGFDAALAFLRGQPWRLGFGRFPIVLSTNLFLWFHDDVYFLQYVMVAVGVLGKVFVTWERGGKRTHIFNPSAFSLSVASMALLLTGSTGLTWGPTISNSLAGPEHIYLWIFACGLIVQGLFRVTLVTLCAAVTMWSLGTLYLATTGVYFFLTSEIPIAVFLGLHLLVTDPSTSPRSDLGRAIFGGLYGLSVMVLFAVLDVLGQPTFYDKMLCVPLLNASVRWIDGLAAQIHACWPAARLTLSPVRLNAAHMGVWVLFFASLFVAGSFARDHEAKTGGFWEQACREERLGACRHLDLLLSAECDNGQGIACAKLGAFVYHGAGMPRDPVRGQDLVQRGCALGFAEACRRLPEFAPPVSAQP